MKNTYLHLEKNGFIFASGYPWFPSKNFSQFGPAVWPSIADINILAWEPSHANVTNSYSSRYLPKIILTIIG